jgi:hypothetical protein
MKMLVAVFVPEPVKILIEGWLTVSDKPLGMLNVKFARSPLI